MLGCHDMSFSSGFARIIPSDLAGHVDRLRAVAVLAVQREAGYPSLVSAFSLPSFRVRYFLFIWLSIEQAVLSLSRHRRQQRKRATEWSPCLPSLYHL